MAEFNYFEDLKSSLEEAVAFNKGERKRCRVQVRETVIPKYRGPDVQKLRMKLNLSQRAMAAAVGVSPRTVEAWERGTNIPGGTAQHLLYLFDKQPQLVDHLVVRK